MLVSGMPLPISSVLSAAYATARGANSTPSTSEESVDVSTSHSWGAPAVPQTARVLPSGESAIDRGRTAVVSST